MESIFYVINLGSTTDTWIMKMSIYIMKSYATSGENESMQFAATWMELEDTMFSEVRQKMKDKYRVT